MSLEQIWAPWRLAYIKGSEKAEEAVQAEPAWLPGADQKCFLCRGVAEQRDAANLIVCRGTQTITILNRYPYNNGHLLVAPRRHVARLDQLSADEQLECTQTLARCIGVFERLMNAEGFNVGLNLGRVAGAGVPGHLHWHLVPRWSGDTNFMPVTAGVNVIPQSLEALHELLSQELAKE